MDILHSRNPLNPLLLTNPRINLRQRRRTKRIVIIQQQFQACNNCNRKTPFFKRRRFCFQILKRSRNADVNCPKYTISVLYLLQETNGWVFTGINNSINYIHAILDAKGRRSKRMTKSCAVHGVNVRYAEKHGRSLDKRRRQRRAIEVFHSFVEREDGVVDVDDVLFDGLAGGEDGAWGKGGGEGEGGEQGDEEGGEMHGVWWFCFGVRE
jgi:hypothetical protein